MRHHDEVERSGGETGRLLHACRDPGDLQGRGDVARQAVNERRYAGTGRDVVAEKPPDRAPGAFADGETEDVLDRTAAARFVRRP